MKPGLLARGLVLLVRGYQLAISPLLGPACRFEPSCSRYAVTALERYGAWRGSTLTVRRVLRCRPGGGHGYDPVPFPPTEPADPESHADSAEAHGAGMLHAGTDECLAADGGPLR